MSLNHVALSGNLTRDAELASTAGGTMVLKFGLAVNERVRNPQTDQWEDRPNYIDCTVFGNRAQALSQWLHKGSKVALDGRLRWSSWEKDGQRRSKLEVIVNDLEMLSRNDAQNAPGAPQTHADGYSQPAYAQQQARTSQAVQDDFAPSDIPF